MKYLTLAALAVAGAALTGCYTEPKVTVNTPPATAVVGAPPATVVTPAPTTTVVTPAPGTAVVVPAGR